jgi:hypothetical protein
MSGRQLDDEYMHEEKPKMEAAELKVCGLYVMYVSWMMASRRRPSISLKMP